MNFVKVAMATILATGLASTASAQDNGAYINVGVDAVEFDVYTLGGKIGYNFTKNFGVEGQGSFGIIDIDEDFDGEEISTGIDTSFGAFGVARFPVSDKIEIFGRAGYHFTQFGVSNGAISVGLDTDGFAFGLGGQYLWDGLNGVRLEYTNLDVNFDDDLDLEDDESSQSGDVVSLSYVRKF